MKNNMIEFAKENRTTSYFKDYAISEIRIAYCIMEYLAPDSVYPADDLSTTIQTLLLTGNIETAVEQIYDTLDIDCFSSAGSDSLLVEAIELAQYLLPLYKKDNIDYLVDKERELENKLIEVKKKLKEVSTI